MAKYISHFSNKADERVRFTCACFVLRNEKIRDLGNNFLVFACFLIQVVVLATTMFEFSRSVSANCTLLFYG